MDKEGGKRRRACELEKKRGSTQKLVQLLIFIQKDYQYHRQVLYDN